MSDLRDYARRIEALEAEIAERNSDKSEVYKEAKDSGFDAKVLRQVIAYRRRREKMGDAALEEADALFNLYLSDIEGTPSRARAHAREEQDRSAVSAVVVATPAGRVADESPATLPDAPTPRPGIAIPAQPAAAKTLVQEPSPDGSGAVRASSAAAPSLPDTDAWKRRLRPHCLHPEMCAGQGVNHCRECTKAMEAQAA